MLIPRLGRSRVHRFLASVLVLLLGLATGLPAFATGVARSTPPAHDAAEPELETILLGTGCFWGAEKFMGQMPGVVDIEVGYANGDESVPGNYQAS